MASGAMKSTEMTLLRAIGFVEVFDRATKAGIADWRDIDPREFYKAYGKGYNHTQPRLEIEELWKRHRSGTLKRQVVEYADHLDTDGLTAARKKEIGNAINKYRKESGS